MGQLSGWMKTFATQPGDLSLIPRIHVKVERERTKYTKLPLTSASTTVAHVPAHIGTLIINNNTFKMVLIYQAFIWLIET